MKRERRVRPIRREIAHGRPVRGAEDATPEMAANPYGTSGPAAMPANAQSSPSLAALPFPDFVTALKGGLREFSRPDLLAGNPLLRSRLLSKTGHAGPAALRALLTETVDELFASPGDEKFRRVIELTYFRPAPKQEAAADRLSLAFGTYRRHLTTAVGRLARSLWNREQLAWANETHLEARPEGIVEEPTRQDTRRPPRLSIVVLPLVNLGCCDGQDHFVDGITEILTTDLSRIPGASVIASNTAFSYKGKAIDARQIGSELGVRYVMEGSVQSAAGRIRVNAQLIDAETGAHLWAERFDKPLANLFDTQDEITARLARTLDVDQNLAPCYAAVGWGKVMFGRAEETEGHIIEALRLSPRDSFVFVWCTMAGTAKLVLGRHDEAVTWLCRAIEANKTYPTAHLTLAAALAQQGKIAEARAAAAAGMVLAPTFTIRRFRGGVLSDNPTYLGQRECLYKGLRLAGVPEGEPQEARLPGCSLAPPDRGSRVGSSLSSNEALRRQDFRDGSVRRPTSRR